MRHLLIIQTHPENPLAQHLRKAQEANPDQKVERVDLTTRDAPDYPALVEKIFKADSVQVM